MVEFALFKTRQFIGSNLVAFIITFAMMGTFFFMALYMQDILGYSALEAGVRFLPTTIVIAVIAPISGRLADRLGPATPMSAGLAVLAVSMFLFAGIDTTTTYAGLVLPFVLMGLGIALVMSPMSTAAMNAVDVTKAGVASGILSMGRMVGGSLGVAVTGALFQGAFTNRLDQLIGGTSKASSDKLFEAVSSGQTSQIGDGANGQRLISDAHDAFVHALTGSMRLSLGVVLVGLVVAGTLLRGGLPSRARRAEQRDPEAVAEPMGAH
jgi:MFS family permease